MGRGKGRASATADDQDAQLGPLQARLGHTFAEPQLLLDALTHRSYAYEFAGPEVVSNERLEFLGDAALALLSAASLYRRFPEANEGELTSLRAALVRASTLASFARRIGLGPYLRLGRGEELTGGRDRDLLIASAFEATLGALYLDAGLDGVRRFLEPLLDAELERGVGASGAQGVKDPKSLLQELAQAQLGVTPTYRVVSETGPSHDRAFLIEALLGELVIGRGEGRSKRQAEQAAAQVALADEGWLVPTLREEPDAPLDPHDAPAAATSDEDSQ